MLIDVRAKVTYNIGNKKKKSTDTYVVDKEFFSEAEYTVTQFLENQKTIGEVDSYDIVSLRQSIIKEVASQFTGQYSYIVTLKDTYHDDKGNEKSMRYKVLLWADNPSGAMHNALELQRQGYDMSIEGIKEVNYIYISNNNGQTTTRNEEQQSSEH